MKITYSQILLLVVVIGIIVLAAINRPLPQSLILVLGVLCPSPLQAGGQPGAAGQKSEK